MTFLSGLGLGNQQAVKRKAFFSFHYDDIMRVNNVRLCGEFKTPETRNGTREIEGFYDRSLWEQSKTVGPDNIKRMICDGMQHSSVACVLIGSQTFQRRWVRYEIARSIVDGRGLIAIHLNSINHHQGSRGPHPLGPNPLGYMGLGRSGTGQPIIYEAVAQNGRWIWQTYQDYVTAVPLPAYFAPVPTGGVIPLSQYARTYDWVTNVGHDNIGTWLDVAAKAVGR